MASKPRAKSGAAAPTYQLKIVLKWSRPSIWRRVVVRADLSLHRLHDVIQIAMGWTDSHPHQFMVGSGRTPICYGMRSSDGDGMGDTLDETRYAVWDLAPKPKGKFVYEYDFGDGWIHDVTVEKTLAVDAPFQHPVCLGGANPCPPEDCGGVGGYYRLLEILGNPKHPEYADLKDWMGDGAENARFDLDAVNEQLRRLKA